MDDQHLGISHVVLGVREGQKVIPASASWPEVGAVASLDSSAGSDPLLALGEFGGIGGHWNEPGLVVVEVGRGCSGSSFWRCASRARAWRRAVITRPLAALGVIPACAAMSS